MFAKWRDKITNITNSVLVNKNTQRKECGSSQTHVSYEAQPYFIFLNLKSLKAIIFIRDSLKKSNITSFFISFILNLFPSFPCKCRRYHVSFRLVYIILFTIRNICFLLYSVCDVGNEKPDTLIVNEDEFNKSCLLFWCHQNSANETQFVHTGLMSARFVDTMVTFIRYGIILDEFLHVQYPIF